MPPVLTHVLIVNRQLKFNTTIKKALEQVGGFDIAAFTSGASALEYAGSVAELDVAVIDFTLPREPGIDLILKLRALHPNVAVLVTPRTPVTQKAVQDFELQGTLDVPIGARQLIPLLHQAVAAQIGTRGEGDSETAASLPGERERRARVRPIVEPPQTPAEEAPPDFTVEAEPPAGPIDSGVSDSSQESISAFQKLAAEEPPMPTFEEGGTVRDIRETLLDSGMQQVVEILQSNAEIVEPDPLPPDDFGSPEEPNLARQILNRTLDHSQSIRALHDIVSGREDAPETGQAEPMDDADAAQLQADLGLPEPEVDENDTPVEPAPALSEAVPPLDEEALANLALQLTQASLESAAEATLIARTGRVIAHAGNLAEADIAEISDMIEDDWEANPDQSRIRFINLSGSGQDYLLFSRHTDAGFSLTMIFAGNMPLRVIRRQSERLIRALQDLPPDEESAIVTEAAPIEADDAPAWEVDADDDAPIPSAADPAKDSMAESAPQAAAETDAGPVGAATTEADNPPPYTGPYTGYTFLWLLRDTEAPISESVAQAIVDGMGGMLSRQSWKIGTLDVHEDFIYLLADAPGERPAYEIVAELKTLAERLALQAGHTEDLNASTSMWADSYLALLPGRPLDTEEIQNFIRFSRMRG